MGATKFSYGDSKIEPAPLVQITRNSQRTTDGQIVGTLFNFDIRGTLLAYKGSPTSSGTFYTGSNYWPDARNEPSFNETVDDEARLAAIIRKQEALRDLFSQDGRPLEIQSADGSFPMKCYPRMSGPIVFEQGVWYNTCNYNITLEADVVYINGQSVGEFEFTEFISSANETWSLETNDLTESETVPLTYRLTHTLNAVGKRYFDDNGLQKEAWQQARDWVHNRLGFDQTFALGSGVVNLPDYYQGRNHVRSETIGEMEGNYGVTESWILSSGNALEDFSISVTQSVDSRDQVNIQGTVTGLEERDGDFNLTSTKYDNASGKFVVVENNLLHRAKAYSGKSYLNPEPLSKTVGRNVTAGTITYNTQYDDRPGNCFEDTKSEVISITNNFDTDVIASIGVLGRRVGPVLQDIGTHEATRRGLNIELVFDSSYGGTGCDYAALFALNPRLNSDTSGTLQSIIDAADPIKSTALNNLGQAATIAYITSRTETWEPTSLRYNFNTEWTYE